MYFYSFLSLFSISCISVGAFSTHKIGGIAFERSTSIQLNESTNRKNILNSINFPAIVSAGIIGSTILFPGNALADEIGREVEAPTLFTGETVLVRVLHFFITIATSISIGK